MIKARTNNKIARIKPILNSPVLPNCSVLTSALGRFAIIPAVIIRGLNYRKDDIPSSKLHRSKNEDLFRK